MESWESWVNWIIQTATMLGIGAIGFLLKQFMSRIQADIKAQSGRIDALEDKLNTTINSLPYNYTLREDFIRTTAGFDKKLDKVIDLVTELKRGQ